MEVGLSHEMSTRVAASIGELLNDGKGDHGGRCFHTGIQLAADVLPNVRIAAKLNGCQRTKTGIPPAMTDNHELRRTPFIESSTLCEDTGNGTPIQLPLSRSTIGQFEK
jgi:hypothetical protein